MPLCLLAFISVSVLLKLPVKEKSDWKTKLRRIDFLGAVVLVGAVFGFLLGLERGSNVSWSLPITIVSLSVSTVLFVLFVLIEIYLAAEPFAPGHIIFDRTLFACYCCNFFSFGGWLAAIFYIPLFFQAVDDVSATVAGLRLLPSIIAGVSGSLFSGFVMRWTGKYFWITVAGYTSLTCGLVLIFLSSGAAFESIPVMILGMVMSGFGNGIGVTTTLIGLSKCLHIMVYVLRGCLQSCSLECCSPGSSRCDRLLVSVPIPGIGHRALAVRYCHPAASPNPTTLRVARQQGHRSHRRRSTAES